MIDLREVGFFQSRHSTIRGCALLGCVTILGVTAIISFRPHPKVVNHTATVTTTVTETTPAPKPKNEPDADLGMIQEEFDSIQVGESLDSIWDAYPESPGNVPGDNLTFWNREGGGKYWVRWSKAKAGKQKVVRKWVENG